MHLVIAFLFIEYVVVLIFLFIFICFYLLLFPLLIFIIIPLLLLCHLLFVTLFLYYCFSSSCSASVGMVYTQTSKIASKALRGSSRTLVLRPISTTTTPVFPVSWLLRKGTGMEAFWPKTFYAAETRSARGQKMTPISAFALTNPKRGNDPPTLKPTHTNSSRLFCPQLNTQSHGPEAQIRNS